MGLESCSVKMFPLHWIYAQGSEMASSRRRCPPSEIKSRGQNGLPGSVRVTHLTEALVLPPLCGLSGFGISKLFNSDQNLPPPGGTASWRMKTS